MINISDAVYFYNLNMKVSHTTFEKAGDVIADNPLSKIGFSAGTYVRRHYIDAGRFEASYPSTQYQSDFGEVGMVWPYDDHKDVDNYHIESLVDNSSFYCFLPIGKGRQVLHEFYDVNSGDNFVAKKGKIYSPSIEYYLDGTLQKAFGLVACVDNDKIIEFRKNGKVAAFYATTL